MTAGLRPLSSQWWLLVGTWHWCPGHAESSFNRTEQTSPWAPMCFHRGQAQRGFPSAGPAPTLSTDVCVYHPPTHTPLGSAHIRPPGPGRSLPWWRAADCGRRHVPQRITSVERDTKPRECGPGFHLLCSPRPPAQGPDSLRQPSAPPAGCPRLPQPSPPHLDRVLRIGAELPDEDALRTGQMVRRMERVPESGDLAQHLGPRVPSATSFVCHFISHHRPHGGLCRYPGLRS